MGDRSDTAVQRTCHFCEELAVTPAETDGVISWVCGRHAADADSIVPVEEVARCV